MDALKELFGEAHVVATHDVAAAFEISENDARDWAAELGVARVGASFAWARPDVEALQEQLETENEESGPEDDEDDPDSDDEDPDDEDE